MVPELARVQKIRTEAFRAFHQDVTDLEFPKACNDVKIKDDEFDQFMTAIDKIEQG